MTDDPKREKAAAHVAASIEALERLQKALEAGEPLELADAKALEAAGCYIRRNCCRVPA